MQKSDNGRKTPIYAYVVDPEVKGLREGERQGKGLKVAIAKLQERLRVVRKDRKNVKRRSISRPMVTLANGGSRSKTTKV